MKNVIFYTADNGKCYIKIWLMSLDKAVFNKVMARLARVKAGNLGDHHSIKGELWELRFDNGLRIYYTEYAGQMVILFHGGNKKTQPKDIARAQALLEEFKSGKGEL